MRLDEVHIELCSYCNAGCSHCTWQSREDAKQLMATSTALELIDECATLGVRTVNFNGVGSPTLHSDLLNILRYAEEALGDYWLSTNCKRLHLFADTMSRLSKLTVTLAVPWAESDDALKTAIDNAKSYLGLSPGNKRVYVQMVCSVDAERNYWRFLAEFYDLVHRTPNAVLYFKQPFTWPNMKPVKGFVPKALTTTDKVVVEVSSTPMSIGRGCNMPDRFLKVNADGTVSPCCVGLSNWGLPNYYKSWLTKTWQSEKMEDVRRLWRLADDSIPCGHCLKRTDC